MRKTTDCCGAELADLGLDGAHETTCGVCGEDVCSACAATYEAEDGYGDDGRGVRVQAVCRECKEGVMKDETEGVRRILVDVINSDPRTREGLENAHGQVWDTSQLTADFDVQGFAAPFVVVRRRSDGARGTLAFQHSPRFYFGFEATS